MTTKEKLLQKLKELQAQIDSMPDDKPQQWEPEGGEWYVNGNGKVRKATSKQDYAQFGTVYQTKEQSDQAIKLMHRYNLLLNWVIEHGGDGVTGSYYVTKHNNCYKISREFLDCKDLSKIYMSKKLAQKLGQGLNDGTIDFDNVE